MPIQVVENKIPVPYGHIAVKVWGNFETSHIHVLALHGWMHNASTFDPICELLNDQYYIIAMDLPGHGFSSHYPSGNLMIYLEL